MDMGLDMGLDSVLERKRLPSIKEVRRYTCSSAEIQRRALMGISLLVSMKYLKLDSILVASTLARTSMALSIHSETSRL